MLIIDTHHPAAKGKTRPDIDWPEPVCVVNPFDREAGPMDEGTLDPNVFLFEMTSDAPSRLALMRDVIVGAHRTAAQPRGALLFLSGEGTAPDAMPEGSDIVWTTDEDSGDVTMLAAGPDVTAHPMFITFFTNMNAGLTASHTEVSLGMMKQYLGG
ncbi:hypothetical protein [Pseudaestuariivita atlantica]|uniref:Uncharacterized protein n=1 Tax=Pseudaestuariivita atlantica TaxID=1317121 RepID=A0A0L1JLD4_9RHOB|nr:hypothetical protein [Pseudaestuariivita atlantica]KNG92228.1 hypothetical protein ATO11_18370 [Pseudaestuariivita atlantica]